MESLDNRVSVNVNLIHQQVGQEREQEHGEYKFNREQRRRLKDRRSGAKEHSQMGKGHRQKDWVPYNHNESSNGKGDSQRLPSCNSAEMDLRWDLAFGYITQKEFEERMENLNG